MSNREDEYDDDLPSIVPERDELHDTRSRKRGNSLSDEAPAGGGAGPSGGGNTGGNGGGRSAGTSGAVVFVLSVLVVGLLAMAGAGYYFYDQGRQALAELRNAQGRLADLESRLAAVGEDTEETTLNMIERIDMNFSEIDKLWAARNANRSNIAENRNTIEQQQDVIETMENALSRQAERLNETSSALSSVQSRLETITGNISGLERMGERLTSMNEELAAVRETISSLQNNVNNRLNTIEQDIESINVYRLQLNQTINAIQNDIDRLEERVGSP